MRRLARYADGSVDEIRASKCLEHLPRTDIMPTLFEWHRVLRPGGMLTVIVPDCEAAVQAWIASDDPFHAAAHSVWGLQNRPGNYHHFGFFGSGLRLVLERAGFEVRRFRKRNLNLFAMATKVENES